MMEFVAPKDPQDKREGFYVLLDQQIGGIPQDDGTSRHPIYLSDTRLVTFARMVGCVEDESMLELLKTAQGFRKLVYGIGVSLTAQRPDLEVTFTYSCNNVHGEGTGSAHSFTLKTDGVEQVLELGGLDWKEGDTTPGAFLFQLPKVEDLASATVKLYVNDGYHVPDIDPDKPVDFGSPAYREMIARSCLSCGNNHRIKKLLARIRAGEPVNLAFLGGSITQGAGAVPIQDHCYARRTFEAIRDRYAPGDGSNLRYIKAGVGGTPSQLGLIRYDRDITRDGTTPPDLVVVEFAVNDEGDETQGVCYESLVRRLLAEPQKPAVILLFSVFANDWNLKERLAPIGWRYQLPMVDLLEAVSPQFVAREGVETVITKRQYFYDVYHPSNRGHQVMTDSILYLLDRLDRQQEMAEPVGDVPVVYGSNFETIRLMDKKDQVADAKIDPGSFTGTDTDLQCVPMDHEAENTPEFPYNWKKEPGNQPFVLEMACSKLQLIFKDSGNLAFGKAEVKVDGKHCKVCDPLEAGWTHCHATVLLDEDKVGMHRVEISMAPGEEEKLFTILGFAYVR